MSIKATEETEAYESMISTGVNDNVRQSIAIVELSGGQVSEEAVEISNRAELGEVSDDEEIAMIIELHKRKNSQNMARGSRGK